jgi:pantothenate kinase
LHEKIVIFNLAFSILIRDYYICGKATGGGAYKYADLFKERLGVSLEKEDEMDCLVAGANFLLKVPIQSCIITI